MKFAKSFYGCKAGDIYPTHFQVGEECPEELIAITKKLGVLEAGKKSTASPAAKDIKPEGTAEIAVEVPEDKES